MDTTIGYDLSEAARLLQAGELVAIPTETVYGLAANALNPDAVAKVFEAKQRPSFDPLIVHIPSAASLEKYADKIPETALKLASVFWPGPLTLLLPKQEVIPALVTSGLDTVAIRVPSHPVAAALLKMLEFPLAAPSANLFGQVSPTRALHVKAQLEGRIPYIIEGGDCEVGVESTIIGFPEGSLPTVYRLGGVPAEEIEATIGPVLVQSHSSSNPLAPGMLKSHYSPRKPLLIADGPSDHRNEAVYLRFSDYLPGIPETRQLVLSRKADLREAAKNLFDFIRQLDASPAAVIVAELLPETGLGRAVNDRLRRAAVRE
ncbi:L-threonylcarbamoyladenylate synthase [Ravibacter arvi]|uniref:Threonylcarbamoyl-AMP synthase n=1 Tax=Ravibacter arvi TaxID=2051041 RepID=A0ABP8M7L4_9BACT